MKGLTAMTLAAVARVILGMECLTRGYFEIPDEETLGVAGNLSMADCFLATNWNPILLHTLDSRTDAKLSAKTEYFLGFLYDAEQLDDFLAYILHVPFFKIDAYVYLIIAEISNVKQALELIWKHSILNYIIIFQGGSNITSCSYNPFSKEISAAAKSFPDKLKNMHGYKWHIGMVTDYPLSVMVNGVLQGEDPTRIRDVSSLLNATLNMTVFPNTATLKGAILQGAVNFSYSKLLNLANNTRIVHASYPLDMDYLVIIVPTADLLPQAQYIVLVFDHFVWANIFGLFAIMTFVIHVFCKATNFAKPQAALAALQIFLGHSYGKLSNSRLPLKILFISWMAYSLLINIAFSTALNRSLVTPKYSGEIENFAALAKTDLKIVINYKLESIMHVFNPIRRNLLFVNDTELIISMIQEYKKGSGFVLHWSSTESLIKKKDHRNRHVYRILPEYFATTHNVYNFPENSPFLKKIDIINLLLAQHGITNFGAKKSNIDVLFTSDQVILTLKHLQSIFIILTIGCCMAISAFIGEIAFKHK